MRQVLHRKACLVGTSLSLLLLMVGCGSSGTGTSTVTPPAVTITLGTTPASLTVSQMYQFSATVANATNTGVTWAVGGVMGGNTTLGTISTTGLYTAPGAVPGPATVTITATSQADTTKSASASVTIAAAIVSISITTPSSVASLTVNSTTTFTAAVTGTSNTAVTWTVNGVTNGNSTFGTITGSGLSVTYNAPASVPSPATFNVTATSVADNTKSASVNVTITSAVEVALDGASLSSTTTIRGGTIIVTALVTGAAPNLTFAVDGVTNGNSAFGTITGSYPSYTYNAPVAIPGNNNPVTIVATQGGTGQTASLTVTINPSTTTPNAIAVTGGNVNGVNLSLTSLTPTLRLADVGTCGYPNVNQCSASVSGIQVSKSGAATASCGNATCTVWLLGQGLTNGGGTALASGLTVSVTHGGAGDVTVSNVTPLGPSSGLTDITFQIVVSSSAPTGNRDVVVTLGDGETQIYVGAIQIVN